MEGHYNLKLSTLIISYSFSRIYDFLNFFLAILSYITPNFKG